MSMLLRRYDAVGSLLTTQAVTIGAHGSLQASPAAHSGAPLHVEVWSPKPGITMRVTYTDSSSVTQVIPPADMIHAGESASGATFSAVTPARLCDTRSNGSGCPQGALAGNGGEITVQVAGAGGLPASGITAAALNIVVTAPTAAGFLVVWPDGEAKPGISALNYATGSTIANMITVKVGTNGKVRIANHNGGTAHVIVDAFGAYT